MSRPGAILIPLVGGFLLTLVTVTWRSGWWQQHETHGSAVMTASSIEPRRSNLRIVQVEVPRLPAAPVAAAPAPPAPVAPAALPQPAAEIPQEPSAPRVDPGDSAELLEAPARKFARGSDSSGD